MKKLIYFILFFSFAFSSCITRPDYVIEEDAMVALLTDVHRSEGLIEVQQMNNTFSGNESFKKSIMAAVLVKNGVTRAQYDSSLVWYGQNLKYLVRIYSKVQKNLSQEIDYWTNYETEFASPFGISEKGDSVQLWTIDKHTVLNEDMLLSMKFWEIPSDSNYVASDSIIWHFSVPFVPDSHYIVATLSMRFNDDNATRTISNSAVIRNDTIIDLSCVSDTTKLFDSVIASVSLMKDSLNVFDDSAIIDSLSLVRIHK